MRRFGGSNTMDDRDAAQYHDRFCSGQDCDREFDNNTYQQSATEYLGKLDDDQFQQAARNAYAQAPQQEREGLVGGLMRALGMGGGGGAAGSGLGGVLGMRTTDPRNMDPDDYARLMNYARRERPEAVQQTVQEKPWFLKAMGNPVVAGALAVAAAKMLQRQRSGGGGRGLF
ncbi:MAG: hypothetical protein EOP84_37140 [Verrucomicrobiaceae bacterium]|nr:MAG: hypothetical protein EOP84_37140 [Verrucomicrobiaceae bacterium]